MMEETKTSRARVAFALLCGLAVCCSVMYITSDGADEVMLDAKHEIGSGQDVFNPRSVQSDDVLKTARLITKTPDTLRKGKEGRERLLTFLDKVEANIAKEVESRKADIAAIRQQMAKNMELNAAARKKMRTMLLAKMAANAKIAKDDLRAAMRRAQKAFAEAAATESRRNKETRARSRKTREIMKKNKAEAAKELALAVQTQQRALATLNQQTNAKIKQTNKHIGANAAAIKENAKKARQDLDNEMDSFNKKIAHATEEARKGRDKLANQAATQDKAFRTYAANEVQRITSENMANFKKVRDQMAADRAHADAEISNTASRMDAVLATQHALENKRFAETVNDIAAAKKEAADRVSKFTSNFKTDILNLQTVASAQTKKLDSRVTQLAGVVKSNKLEQAKVDNAVQKELTRMINLGQKRYDEHLAKDKELRTLMSKNKEDTQGQIKKMANTFLAAVRKIENKMKEDRKHHEHQLSKASTALYKTLLDNKVAQDKVNKKLTAETRRVELDAAKALREAKEGFASKIGALTETVEKNAKKVNKKMKELTGVVTRNAVKDAQGRLQLRKLAAHNKGQVNEAIRAAIDKGEQRALQIEKKMKGINAKNRKDLNHRITTEIGALRKQIHGQVLDLELESKEARAEMKKELLFAIRTESDLAAKNLKDSVAWAEGEFSKLHANLAAEKKTSAAERANLKRTMEADKKKANDLLNNAVAAQNKALLSFKNEMCNELGSEDIKGCPKSTRGKLNKRLDAEAARMKANAKKVQAEMKAQAEQIETSLEDARKAAQAELAATSAASVKRYNDVIKSVKDGVAAAQKLANEKFSAVQIQMANDRKDNDQALATAVNGLNDAIAKASALEDTRFSKTVKDLEAAKKEAREQVQHAKKEMIENVAAVTAEARAAEKRVLGDIEDVSAMIVSDKAEQARINKKVDEEVKRLFKLSDTMETNDKKARGVIRQVMNENKRIAHEEVQALGKRAREELRKVDSEQNAHLSGFKKDLTDATKKVYAQMAKDQKQQDAAMAGLTKTQTGAKAAVAGALKSAKKEFESRFNSLTNAVIANQKDYEKKMTKITGVVMDWKKASTKDRGLIRKQRKVMETKLRAKIVRAIQIGEAKMKAVQERAMANIATEKKALLTTISVAVENMADNIFATVQGNRQKTADNYLSLKAYAAAAADKVTDYIEKGKGRNLSSIGDLLQTLAQTSMTKAKPSQGEGFGLKKIRQPFSNKKVSIDNSVTKINGLVNEYMSALKMVKNRWMTGLGKYLLGRIEMAMQGSGALEVDKVSGRAGNYVFINGRACGLSSRLSDFESLAVPMTLFEQTLAKLTERNTFGMKAHTRISVKPPEWQGD
jgi:hypothetical protein